MRLFIYMLDSIETCLDFSHYAMVNLLMSYRNILISRDGPLKEKHGWVYAFRNKIIYKITMTFPCIVPSITFKLKLNPPKKKKDRPPFKVHGVHKNIEVL